MSGNISFSTFELSIGDNIPSKELLRKAFSVQKMILEYDDYIHHIECCIINSRFYWLYSNYGKPMPRRDVIYDQETGRMKDNPRTEKQNEPKDQLFFIYDSQSAILYLSNCTKKSFIEHYISTFTDDEIVIKNIYKSIDDFLAAIKTLESIKFTGSRDLLNRKGDLFTNLRNIFGYGEPEEFAIEATYRIPVKETIKNEILRLFGFRKTGTLKTLVCIGKDERGFDSVFNEEKFIKKISISARKDRQRLYSPEDVKSKAIKQIENSQNV